LARAPITQGAIGDIVVPPRCQWKATFLLFKNAHAKICPLNFTIEQTEFAKAANEVRSKHPERVLKFAEVVLMKKGFGEMPEEEQGVETLKGGGSHPYGGEMPMEEIPEERAKGAKPDFRVLQPQVGKDGKQYLSDVGALWRNVSKSGNVFYTLKIGKLRLLVFENRERDG